MSTPRGWLRACTLPSRSRPSRTCTSTWQSVVAEANTEKQLVLIRAHPDLAGRAARAGDLTAASTNEQAGAGLDRLSGEEFERFHALNDAYKERFDFPFILAVKGHDKDSILAAFETRLNNDPVTERQTALAEIYKIARFRLNDLVRSS